MLMVYLLFSDHEIILKYKSLLLCIPSLPCGPKQCNTGLKEEVKARGVENQRIQGEAK